jgi:hypothetical protein
MLNFESAQFVDPKIQIAPRELPVEAMIKVGNVLQDRFDKAMENETKTQAFIRKLKSSSNPADHAVADQIMSNYNQRLKDRATNGRYQDMQWQTQQDALDVAGMYEGLSNRNKKIQQDLEEINKSSKYLSDASRNKAKEMYQKELKSSKFDVTNNILTDLDVNPFNEAADVDKLKWAVTYGHLMKPTVNKVSGTTIVGVDALGNEIKDPKVKPTMLMTKTRSGNLVKLTAQELQQALTPAALNDPAIQAELNRNVYRAGLDINTPEGKAYKQKLFNEQVLPSIGAASGLLRQNQDMSSDAVSFHNMPNVDGSSKKGGGRFKPYNEGVVPVNSLASDYVTNTGETELRKSLNKSLNGDTKELTKITNFINETISNAKIAKDPILEKKYVDFKNIINEINKLPKDKKKQVETFMSYGIINEDDAKFDLLPADLQPLIRKLTSYTNTDFLDTDSEDSYTEYVKSGKGIKQTNIVQPNLEADGAIENLNQFNSMLTKNYFNDYDSKNPMEKDTKYTLKGMTETPLGNGVGHLLELSDEKGNSIFVTPKDDRILENLDNVFPSASRTNAFKDLPDFYENETKTIKQTLKEIGQSLNKDQNGKDKLENDFSINYKNGKYILIDPQGKAVHSDTNLIFLLDNFLPLD